MATASFACDFDNIKRLRSLHVILPYVKNAYEYAVGNKVPLVMLGSLYMYGEVAGNFDKIMKNN